MAVGNHELMTDQKRWRRLSMRSASRDFRQHRRIRLNVLNGKVMNHTVLEVGGEKIGLVSALATPSKRLRGPNVVFKMVDSLAADVATLEAEGVTKIIALNHVGLAKDLAIAEAVEGWMP